MPEIVYQKSQSSKIEKIYSFKYTLIKKSLTKTFLERLFLIGFNQSDFENFKLFKKKNTFVQKKNSLNNNLVLSTQILLSKFFEIEDLFKENNWDLNDNIFFDISFVYTNNANVSKGNKLIQNLYPFWMTQHL